MTNQHLAESLAMKRLSKTLAPAVENCVSLLHSTGEIVSVNVARHQLFTSVGVIRLFFTQPEQAISRISGCERFGGYS